MNNCEQVIIKVNELSNKLDKTSMQLAAISITLSMINEKAFKILELIIKGSLAIGIVGLGVREAVKLFL
jgi:hypothetical protein